MLNNEQVLIRPYEDIDINKIQQLNKAEGWTNLVENHSATKEAWQNSNVTYVIEVEGHGVIGYVRGLTDTRVTLFICEMLIDQKYRGLGLGKELLHYIHSIYPDTRLELLANQSSRPFYEELNFRSFYGFRKLKQE
ncbi:GNAT family N-acetyltransferase [Alkalibacillus haloalkaliphilus]|uniref:GNAT family N-acetyltransferase n=1 Tax=Alkalibacillus haloalkaliphilus TaxID=94136 RepID=UPI0029359A28|nr:GNAT family N-acetyltransferase [Alkalibacillus haloalkaliphilus]MDV2582040.1 GNAT family N-acetyltransferase [Alkalibacillus haloalkaliphilus]